MCSLSPSLTDNTFAGPGVRAWTSGGVDGHYSAGHKETENLQLFPGPGPLTRSSVSGSEAQPQPALHPYTTAAVCAWFGPSSDLADSRKKAALPVESALVLNKTTHLGLVFQRA